MYIAMFGTKGFTVNSNIILTFNDMQITSTLETEAQENTGKKASTYIKGPGLNTFSLKVPLDYSLGVRPLEQINQWFKIKDEATAYPFLLKGAPFLNTKWLLVEVKATDLNIDSVGNMLSATLALTFNEFVRAGTAKKKESSTSKKKKKNTESVYDALKPTQKAELKVSNPTRLYSQSNIGQERM